MDDRTTSEMKRLLDKYKGGRIPPLVNLGDPEAGLISGELLRIYQRGLLSLHSIGLGILLASEDATSPGQKWQKGDFGLNEWARGEWTKFCETLRQREVGEASCQSCDRRRALMAEKLGEATAYLCDNGMIDSATPVSVLTKTIAVLFAGQYKPEEGAVWNPELIHPNGIFRPLAHGEPGVDAWAESIKRIRTIEQQAGFGSGVLLQQVSEDVQTAPETEVSPERLEEVMELMQSAGAQISELATSRFELEKSKLVGWIRGQIARSLVPLSVFSQANDEVWQFLSLALGYVVWYFGLDYALVMSCDNNCGRDSLLLCHFGIPDAEISRWQSQPRDSEALSRLRYTLCQKSDYAALVLKEFSSLSLFEWLHRQHARRKSKCALARPLVATADESPPLLILGRFGRDIDFSECLPADRNALTTIIRDISLVTEIVLLVERLRAKAKEQAAFVEDLAHDLRNPVQNIILEADILAKGMVSGHAGPQLARKLAAQARRLHLMSQRVWTLENIDRGMFMPQDTDRVQPYQTIMEARKSLIDLAERQGIEVCVDHELSQCPPIQVSRGLFAQAVINLLDNAIKYSQPHTEIRIAGGLTAQGLSISFGNRGIPIREEDMERIFDRYYRTKDAKLFKQEGTGIGLYIVKVFADHYGAIDVRSTPIHGTNDYLTLFTLTIHLGRF